MSGYSEAGENSYCWYCAQWIQGHGHLCAEDGISMPPPRRWFCACGWQGMPDAMKANAGGHLYCPECGGSGGLVSRAGEDGR